MKLQHKKCTVCNSKFKPKHGNQDICSAACLTIRRRSYQKKYHELYRREKDGNMKELQHKQCSMCSLNFTPKHFKEKVCSPACFEARRREYQKKYYILLKNNKNCKYCKKNFDLKNNQKRYKYCSDECACKAHKDSIKYHHMLRKHKKYFKKNDDTLSKAN